MGGPKQDLKVSNLLTLYGPTCSGCSGWATLPTSMDVAVREGVMLGGLPGVAIFMMLPQSGCGGEVCMTVDFLGQHFREK